MVLENLTSNGPRMGGVEFLAHLDLESKFLVLRTKYN